LGNEVEKNIGFVIYLLERAWVGYSNLTILLNQTPSFDMVFAEDVPGNGPPLKNHAKSCTKSPLYTSNYNPTRNPITNPFGTGTRAQVKRTLNCPSGGSHDFCKKFEIKRYDNSPAREKRRFLGRTQAPRARK